MSIKAGALRLKLVGILTPPAERHDCDFVAIFLADEPANLEPVHTWHSKIQQH